jgi:hypothetical protein
LSGSNEAADEQEPTTMINSDKTFTLTINYGTERVFFGRFETKEEAQDFCNKFRAATKGMYDGLDSIIEEA